MKVRTTTMAVIVVTVAACTGASEDPTFETAADAARAAIDSVEQPKVSSESISIEGSLQLIDVVSFRPPMGYPIGFTTVVPTDMTIRYVNSGKGDEVRFEAAFAGIRRPDAMLAFAALPEGTDSTAANESFTAIAATYHAQPVETQPGDWAIRRYRPGGGSGGFLALGSQGDSWYYFIASYPPEFGDGMGPRIDLILRRWTFTATGAPLIPS